MTPASRPVPDSTIRRVRVANGIARPRTTSRIPASNGSPHRASDPPIAMTAGLGKPAA